MSKVNVNTIEPSTGTDITLGASGDTITVPSGATITNSGTSTGFGPTLTGSTNNQVVTVTGANAITGEANLTFDGTDLTLGTGNIVFGTAAKGVYLGVTSATAANLLDDYEEGTWTPTDGTGSISFSTNVARYTKIGNIVMCTAYMVLSSAGSGGSNQIFGGLPFTSQNTTGLYTTFPQFWYNNPASIALNGVQINPNSTTIRLIKKASDTTQTWADVVQSDMVNGGEVNMTFWYIT